MTTLEEKEKNRQYVLSHLEEYTLDSHGNFANSSPDIEGNEWFLCFGKDSFTPEGYEELKTKLFEAIIKEIKDWEIVFKERYDGSIDKRKIEFIRNKLSKKRIYKGGFDFEHYYKIIGELGYRENSWQNYEETIRHWEERNRKWKEYWENLTSNSNNQQSSPNPVPEQPQKPDQEQLPDNQTPTPEKPTNNSNKEDKDNPSPNQDQPTDNPKQNPNNPLPSNTNIQSHYNSDKAKSAIENNPTLTTPEQKNQANQLLKLIITAELLVKEQKFNPETLSQLIKEKDNNTLSYQLLNQEGRMDQVINQLQSIQKEQKDKDKSVSKDKNKSNNNVPLGIIIGGGVFLVIVGLGAIVLIVRKKRLKTIKKPH